MAASTWRGHLTFGLVSLPVRLHTAARGETIQLGPKTTSFRDWAQRLSDYVADGGLDHELAHWAGVLEGGCELPVDHTPSEPAAPARPVSVLLSTEDTDALLRTAPTA